MASVWFSPKERVLALTMGVLSQAFGGIFGFILPSIFIKKNDTDEEFKNHLMQMLLLQAIMGTVLSILCILFVTNKPPKPPSASAFKTKENTMSFKESVILIVTNKNIWILTLISS